MAMRACKTQSCTLAPGQQPKVCAQVDMKIAYAVQAMVNSKPSKIALESRDKFEIAATVSSSCDQHDHDTPLQYASFAEHAQCSSNITLDITPNMLQSDSLTRVSLAYVQSTKTPSGIEIKDTVALCPDILLEAKHLLHACQTQITVNDVVPGMNLVLTPRANALPVNIGNIRDNAALKLYNEIIETTANAAQKTMQTMQLPGMPVIPISADIVTIQKHATCNNVYTTQPMVWTSCILGTLLGAARTHPDIEQQHIIHATKTAVSIIQTCVNEMKKLKRKLTDDEVNSVRLLCSESLGQYRYDERMQPTMTMDGSNLEFQLQKKEDSENWAFGARVPLQALIYKAQSDKPQEIRKKMSNSVTNTQQWINAQRCAQDLKAIRQVMQRTEIKNDCEDDSMAHIGKMLQLKNKMPEIFDSMTLSVTPDESSHLRKQLEKSILNQNDTMLCIVMANGASANNNTLSPSMNSATNSTSVRQIMTDTQNEAMSKCCGHACGLQVEAGETVQVKSDGYVKISLLPVQAKSLHEYTADVHKSTHDAPVQLAMRVMKNGSEVQSITKSTSLAQAASITVSTVMQTMGPDMEFNASINLSQNDPKFVQYMLGACGTQANMSGMFVTMSNETWQCIAKYGDNISMHDFTRICEQYKNDIGPGALPPGLSVKDTQVVLVQHTSNHTEAAAAVKRIFMDTRATCKPLGHKLPARSTGMPEQIVSSQETVLTRNVPAGQDILHVSAEDKLRAGAWNNFLLQLEVWKSQSPTRQIALSANASFFDYIAARLAPEDKRDFATMATALQNIPPQLQNRPPAHIGMLSVMQELANLPDFETRTRYLENKPELRKIFDIYCRTNYLCDDYRSVQASIMTCQQQEA